ncbi:MAG TPA: urease accessory protein UreE [Pseudomonadales bacterium]|nr:urease accessory protein UreE [Pseudomonadales bacterium]
MSTLTQVSELLGHHHHGQADARLILDFEARSKSRQRAQLADGEAVALMLPRGTLLRGGDWLRDSRGRLIEVVAAPEWLSCVSGEPLQLLRAAYHLGNRHIPLQIAPGWLRYQHDSVLDQMVIGLGLTLDRQQLPFEPEAGAYQGGHHHAD